MGRKSAQPALVDCNLAGFCVAVAMVARKAPVALERAHETGSLSICWHTRRSSTGQSWGSLGLAHLDSSRCLDLSLPCTGIASVS